jgi:predicted DNA-binding transcriptional regulator AlpA
MSVNRGDVIADPLGQFFETIFNKALDRALDKRNAIFPTVDEETALKIAKINAKPRITIQEAALLLGCSTSHFYTKITAAKKGKTKHPIPFLDLDGVYVLPREELIAWAQMEKKERKRKSSQLDKP